MVFEKFCACSRFRQNKMQNKHTPKRSYDSLDFEHGEGEGKKCTVKNHCRPKPKSSRILGLFQSRPSPPTPPLAPTISLPLWLRKSRTKPKCPLVSAQLPPSPMDNGRRLRLRRSSSLCSSFRGSVVVVSLLFLPRVDMIPVVNESNHYDDPHAARVASH